MGTRRVQTIPTPLRPKLVSQDERDVYRQFRQAQEKYVYFLLAATDASGVWVPANATVSELTDEQLETLIGRHLKNGSRAM